MTAQAPSRLHAPEEQGVTFVELFFDLVFVFAVTQVTALTAQNLTPDGVLRSLVLFWLIWWAWTQFTWTLNPADTTHVVVRVITLAATAAAFVMATRVAGVPRWRALVRGPLPRRAHPRPVLAGPGRYRADR